MNLIPLKKSHAANHAEAEYKRLFESMLALLSESFSDVNCTAMPHLGSRRLMIRYLVSQGLSNFILQRISDDDLRMLVLAWKYRNPKRGTHFLEAYIKAIWGADFEIFQLWQKNGESYTTILKTEGEIIESGENLSDYWLTSRLRITLYGTSGFFDESAAKSLNSVLPARLLIHEITRNSVYGTQIVFAQGVWLGSVSAADVSEHFEEADYGSDTVIADHVVFNSIINQDILI